LILLADEPAALVEAKALCRLLSARGDDERVPDIEGMVTEAFPEARLD
jgi:hypothetical protein